MANRDDFYLEASQKQAAQLESLRAATLADLAAYRANGDAESAAASVQQLADVAAAQQNLGRLVEQYVASQQPAQAPELSAEERAAKPWHRMDYRDTWEIAKNSKHGIDENAFRAGIAEVQRRKARGE